MAPGGKLDVLAVFLDIGLLLENSAVFQSQVGGQLIAMAQFGFKVGVLAVSRDRDAFERAIGARMRAAGIEVFLVRAGAFPLELVRIARALRQVTGARGVRRAYVRGIWGALAIGLGKPSLQYLYDVRGSLPDEMMAVGTAAWKQRVYGALERWSLRRAHAVSAVSTVLAEMVRTHHHRESVSVVPCCIDVGAMSVPQEVAARRRAELGYDAECVLVYSGGLSHYQQVPAMIAIWRRLLRDPGVRFLLLTNEDPHQAPQKVGDLTEFGPRLRHLSLPQGEVAATLAAADIGFMLRDARELNRVASPVKFPEYLGAGLAVVGSPHTGDVSALIESRDVGTLADPSDIGGAVEKVSALIARHRADPQGFKRRGRALARDRYDWHAYQAIFRDHYGPSASDAVARG